MTTYVTCTSPVLLFLPLVPHSPISVPHRVKNRCKLPIKSLSYAVEFIHGNNEAMVSADAGSGVLMSDRGDLPLGFMPTGASRSGSGKVRPVKF